MAEPKILVTTPNGKVGQEVVKLLLEARAPVRVAAHTLERGQEAFPGAEVAVLDYEDPATFAPALEGVAALYLASPATSQADPELALIDAAQAGGVQRVVKLSAMGVESAPDEVPLRAVEKRLQGSGLQWTLLRPTWFMQNFVTLHAPSIQGGTLLEPAGESRLAFIDARDIAAVAVQALTSDGHHGQAYALTGPELLGRQDVAERIGRVLGKDIRYRSCSDQEFHQLMRPYLPESYIQLLLALYADLRSGGDGPVTQDVRKVLGRPPIPFDQFARDHREAWA
ncbi:MAG TPA: SDR family oxidoreductase [Myxococcales bacterium]|nr:SDR family oxidoreductase [Myxococcales bacterium]